jgi:hypothetical protein
MNLFTVSVINNTVSDDTWVGNNYGGGGHSLFQGTVPAFTMRDWVKPQKPVSIAYNQLIQAAPLQNTLLQHHNYIMFSPLRDG